MKRLSFLTCFVSFALLLISCAQKEIEPGDKANGYLITNTIQENITYQWDLGCKKQGSDEVYSCNADTGTNLNLSIGIFDDTGSGDLEKKWSEFKYELFIGDRPVNLEKFGYIEIVHPRVGPMRLWNVVVVGDKPGEITLRDKYESSDEPSVETTTTITFNETAD